MNTAIIAGTIATEPELRYLSDGQTAIVETTLQIPGFGKDAQDETLKAIVWGNIGQEFANHHFAVGTEMVFEGRYKMDLVERDGYKEKVVELNVSRFYPIASVAVPQATTAAAIAPPPTPPATAEPAKATAKASKAKAEAAKADAPVDESSWGDIPF